ncbi:hypothetical protein ACHWQZ_G001547 [Mnemiopsis leidyi]
MDIGGTIDALSILVALFGIFLNLLLLWVIHRNQSVEKKSAFLYKNLALVDIFNCIIIPVCYFNVTGHDFNCLESHKNSILYLLFGGTVNIPYIILILLSIARVMIFKYQVHYKQKVRLSYVRALCIISWILAVGTGTGIWIGFLLGGSMDFNVLIALMKAQSLINLVLIVVCIALVLIGLLMLHQLIGKAGVMNPGSQTSIPESPTTESRLVKNKMSLYRELVSARRTLLYFLVSAIVWSSYPFVFAVSFTLCGPYYNSTLSHCDLLQGKWLADPKKSYALDLLFLCGMSIANSVILLRQKSFKNAILDLWVCLFGNYQTSQVEEDQECPESHVPSQNRVTCPPRVHVNRAAVVVTSTIRSVGGNEEPGTMCSYGTIN